MSLPPAFSHIPFAQPARARANLGFLETRLPGPLFSLLPTVLVQVPDPDGALNSLERFMRAPGSRVLNQLVRQPVLLHYLLALFSHSRFLSETLIQQPELLTWLGREKNLERLKAKEELLEEYARFETTSLEGEPGLALARFKRRQYLRITLKDVLGLSTLVETTLELSTLADVLLEKALAMAERDLRERYGRPQTHDASGRLIPARFAIVSLGKLGGKELNYSSDVDLLFLWEGEGWTSPRALAQSIDNAEFFTRLAQRLLQIIAGVTPEGPVFRVDLRLRPGGGEGDLVLSCPAALRYYKQRAREWELQMLLKARYSAGDPDLVSKFLAAVQPYLFRGPMHFAALESVFKAREQLDRKLDAAGGERLNIKLAAGGIRDIEFLVQCLQRLYGQDDPWVRTAGTLVGLQKLYDKGYLAPHDHFHLASAYEFLRRVEHRLQLEEGQQTHTLPGDAAALGLLARRCGVGSSPGRSEGEEFCRLLEEHLHRVQAISQRVLPESGGQARGEEFALQPPEAFVGLGELSYTALLRQLRRQGSPLCEELDRLQLPARTKKPLGRFLAASLASSVAFEEVTRAAAGLPRAVEILRLSEPLTSLLVRRPERLALLLDLGESHAEATKAQEEISLPRATATGMPSALQALLERRTPLRQQMAGLRRYFSEAVFRWGAREVCRPRPVEVGLCAYTAVAEFVLRAGLAIAEQQAGPADTQPGQYAVIALGRLGTAEMDWRSDADLIFVAAQAEAQGWVRRVAEKLLHVISGYTREGTIFAVDVRLRPRGGEGELVQTGEHILDYFSSSAEVWEAITYLKARPVGGDLDWGEEWCRRLRERLRERFSQWDRLRAALVEMRRRLEEESAKNLPEGDNFKTGAGGFYDLDFILSALVLRHEGLSLSGRALAEQVELVGGAGELSAEEREQLQDAARLLRGVDHGLRLATGQTTARLPKGPRAETVAELAGSCLGETLTAATLAARLEETRRAVRAVFWRVLG